MPIPEFRKKASPAPITIDRRSGNLPSLSWRPSLLLWRAQCLAHVLIALSLSFTLLPFTISQPLWGLLWLAIMAVLWLSACHYRGHLSAVPQHLSLTERGWLLTGPKGVRELQLAGEVLVWSRLIVLRFREASNGQTTHVVFLPDTAPADEQRRLRVWLRTQVWRD